MLSNCTSLQLSRQYVHYHCSSSEQSLLPNPKQPNSLPSAAQWKCSIYPTFPTSAVLHSSILNFFLINFHLTLKHCRICQYKCDNNSSQSIYSIIFHTDGGSAGKAYCYIAFSHLSYLRRVKFFPIFDIPVKLKQLFADQCKWSIRTNQQHHCERTEQHARLCIRELPVDCHGL